MADSSNVEWLRELEDGRVLLRIVAQPKASRSEWVGVQGDRMKVRIAAPPVDGEANEEVLRFVKKSLKACGVRDVALIRGEASKQKDLVLEGATFEALRTALVP